RAAWMEHVAAFFEWDGFLRIERATRAGVPGALDDGDVAIMRMPMRTVHHVGGEPHPLHVQAITRRISGERCQLCAMAVGKVLPMDLSGRQTQEIRFAGVRVAKDAPAHQDADEYQDESLVPVHAVSPGGVQGFNRSRPM